MAVIANLTVKLQAQIAEFQSEFREATKSAEKFQSEFGGIATKASAFGNIIASGAIAAVAGLKHLASEVIDNASNIVDLSNKTGLAMRTIQEFQHVADQTGTTVDAFTNAAFKLGTNLAGGGKSVVNAVERLGLSFAQLKSLSPDEQFNRIAKALSEMENPQERNRIALELFGRQAKDILPAIAEGYERLKASAILAGDEQIKAIDRTAEAWDRFVRGTKTKAIDIAGSIILVGESAIESKKGFDQFANNLQFGGFAAAIAATAAQMKGAADDAERMARAVKNAPKIGEISFGAPGTGSQRPNQFGNVDTEAELRRWGIANDKVTKSVDAHSEAIKRLSDRLSGADLQQKASDLAEAFNRLGAQRNTPIVIQNTAAAALDLFNAGAKLTPELFNIIIEAGRLGDLLPKVNVGMDGLAGVGRDVTREINAANQAIIDMAEIMNSVKFTEGIGNLSGIGQQIGQLAIPEPLPPTFWDQLFDVRGPSLTQSAQFAADGIISSLANAITTGDWSQFAANLKNSLSQFIGSAIASVVPIVGPLLQPLFAALAGKAIDLFSGLFDRNRGRDLVESFAESMGGFDALQAQFAEMGAEGDRLWRLLTQGVGRNNPDQARRAIDEVTRALEAQKQKQKEAGDASVEAARKIKDSQDAATSALRGRLSELSAEYDRLFDSIKNEAPEEVMGVIESQTRERMAAIREEQVETQNALERVLQSLEDSFAGIGQAAIDAARVIQNAFNGITPPNFSTGGSGGGGSSAPSVSFDSNTGTTTFAPTGSMPSPTTSTTTVILEMDSYQVAEAVVPQIPGVVQRYGLAGA
jgi:hypothetical protein